MLSINSLSGFPAQFDAAGFRSVERPGPGHNPHRQAGEQRGQRGHRAGRGPHKGRGAV